MSEYLYNVYDENDDLYDTYDDYSYRDVANYESAGWKEMYTNCIVPSFFQISFYMLPFVVVNIGLCFISKIQARYFPSHHNITHAFSFGCGLCLMHNTLEHGHSYLLQLFVSVYLLIKVSFIEQKLLRFDFIISLYAMMYLIICEILEKDPKVWHHVRGVLMIAVMKSISLAIDIKVNRSLRDQFSIISFLGYMCCPANCIFGPWTSFTEYLNSLTRARSRFKLNFKYLAQIIVNIMLSILCLLFSNCADTTVNLEHSWKWIVAYGTAFSFRMSHYFISFLSQATMVSAGLATNDQESIRSLNVKHTRYFGYTVVRPWSIEFPRSLVYVVVAWNVPIHNFLKQYIFRALKPHGTFAAVFLTYVTSSLLHGLNFQLWATLLTIGVWSYVEFNVRNKLSQIFSACVLVNKCSVPCTKHQLSQNKAMTIFINSIFFILCVINLTYLGAIFDANSQLQTEGYSFKHTLEKWHRLDYVSHWLLILGYLFNWII
ncbi:protein-serine O-palmitoleoyltransferase porcupine [Ochlerotatus camptorhynchus]|uniref:protein-serine O-palmitoleoyltransferase porcupine n=1 Tax=Ochlerotatus camptorhynchus TaxID=644619 RepID=UPI0031D6B511